MERLMDFEYLKPSSTEEILDILEGNKNKAAILAGGTDLLIQMKRAIVSPRILIDIKEADGLKSITEENEVLRIGACATIDTIANSKIIRSNAPILSEAAACIGNPQVRNRATIGGNISNASPAADTATGLLTLDATVTIHSIDRERKIPVENYFTGPGLIDLGKDEILTAIEYPIQKGCFGHSFLKYTIRHSSDCAVVNFATRLGVDASGRINYARIAFGAVAPTPIRIQKAEVFCLGKCIDDGMIQHTAKIVQEEIQPITDIRASAHYRTQIAGVLFRRGFLSAAESIAGGPI